MTSVTKLDKVALRAEIARLLQADPGRASDGCGRSG
jgi:hypothetical protein